MTRRASTLIGFTAILSWALLALFTAASGVVPPFQLTAMAFAIGGMAGAASWFLRGSDRSVFRQPVAVWLLGVTSLFGYHFLYFTALRSAPAAEASLIAYLWPLLIVVFSGFLPGETLRTHHVLGALIGFLGAALIITNGGSLQIKTDYVPGYLAAIVCALIWSAYSVLSRRFGSVPTDIVTGFCLATAILSALCHLALEETVWPADLLQWLAVLGLGLGPVGLAFFAWDHGVKHGDIQVLGASSYAAPLLSTLVLVVAGFQQANWIIATACALITAGAVLAAKDLLFKRKSH
ncbi:MAG: DMT family transporter [Alphaproteobacteria bacterium]|nr:DMT family transporter [Alphaproteobacteria bacterium]